MPDGTTKLTLSRDAQIVAYCMFGFGEKAELTFNRPHIIHPRTQTALDEMVKAGMLVPMDAATLPPGALGWKATALMGNPMEDFPAPKKGEGFPITTE